MADKSVGELIAAQSVTPTDLFVLEQNGTAKKLTGQILENWLVSFADGHGGIQSIVKHSTNALEDTYRITLADTTTFDFIVTNGKAISGVKQTSVSGLTRTYTIAFNDGTSQTFTVTDGRSITNIVKTATNILTDTYTISYNDGTSSTFTVKNGKGIKSFAKVSTAELVDTYRIEYNDDTSDEFTVTNGAKGDKGDNTYTHIKFASQEPTESSHSFGDVPDKWIGFYWGSSSTAPTDWTQYKWYQFKGDKGNTGDPAKLTSSAVEYQVSDSGVIIPSGAWSSSVPVVAQGKYMWTRTTNNFNTGDPVVSYSVARMGIDGAGSVVSVNSVSPDEYGNVELTAENIGALPGTGGNLTGELKMNGQPISGLNPPVEDTHAATKGYVDTAKNEVETHADNAVAAAKNEAVSYTNTQVKKAAPRNLLDNSDFTNPVNQRGVTSFGTSTSASIKSLDRWQNARSTGTLDSNGLMIKWDGTNGTEGFIQQKVPGIYKKGDVFTIAVKVDGQIYCGAITLGDKADAIYAHWDNDTLLGSLTHTDGILWVTFHSKKADGRVLEWAAVYEGEYTLDTLPEYQPKGYGAELAECQRYYLVVKGYPRVRASHITADRMDFVIPTPVSMRITPSLVNNGEEFKVNTLSGDEQTGFAFALFSNNGNAVVVRATKTDHGLTDGLMTYQNDRWTFSADL